VLMRMHEEHSVTMLRDAIVPIDFALTDRMLRRDIFDAFGWADVQETLGGDSRHARPNAAVAVEKQRRIATKYAREILLRFNQLLSDIYSGPDARARSFMHMFATPLYSLLHRERDEANQRMVEYITRTWCERPLTPDERRAAHEHGHEVTHTGRDAAVAAANGEDAPLPRTPADAVAWMRAFVDSLAGDTSREADAARARAAELTAQLVRATKHARDAPVADKDAARAAQEALMHDVTREAQAWNDLFTGGAPYADLQPGVVASTIIVRFKYVEWVEETMKDEDPFEMLATGRSHHHARADDDDAEGVENALVPAPSARASPSAFAPGSSAPPPTRPAKSVLPPPGSLRCGVVGMQPGASYVQNMEANALHDGSMEHMLHSNLVLANQLNARVSEVVTSADVPATAGVVREACLVAPAAAMPAKVPVPEARPRVEDVREDAAERMQLQQAREPLPTQL
jgi:hypothetical protein